MDEKSRQQAEAAFRTTTIIGAAMIFWLLLFVGIAQFIDMTQAPFEGFGPELEIGEILRIVFGALSVSIAILIPVLKNRILSTNTQSPFAARWSAAQVVGVALCESIALFGLVLFFLKAYRVDFYVLLGFSLLLMAYHFPRRSVFERWLNRS